MSVLLQKLFRSRIVTLLLITFLYTLAGKWGLTLAFVNASATAVWPPTGIALASFLIFGFWTWPAILLGAFLVNFTTAGTLFTSLGIAVGNTLEGLLGAYLVNRFAGGKTAVTKSPEIFLFTMFAAGLSTMVSATIGVTTLLLGNLTTLSSYLSVWITWWLGDATGALIFAPVIILWFTQNSFHWTAKRALEFAVLLLILASISAVIFDEVFSINSLHYPLEFLTLPILVWVAFRFTPRETATATFLLSLIAIFGTIQGFGPFSGFAPNTSFLLLQAFTAVISMSSLALSIAVTETKEVREKLLHSEKRFRALIERSSDAISLVDKGGNVIYVSPATKHVLGYSPKEMIGTHGFSIVHPDDLERATQVLTRLIEKPGKVVIQETRLKRKDGRFIWVESTATNLLEEPSVRAVVINYRDISERRRLDEAKNEFVAIAAHQLRTPLSVMRWELEILLKKMKEKLSPEIRKKIQTIYHHNLNMTLLVNELLDVSRIVQDTFPNIPEKVDVSDMVKKQVSVCMPLARKHTITMVFHSKNNIPNIIADPKHLIAIVQNLLSNAVSYTDKNGHIKVSLEKIDSNIHLTVEDDGIGIPPEEQDKIFMKFFRASNAIARNNTGTGLGLFVVKSYVEYLGGKTWFESPTQTSGRGTTMHVTLPIHPLHTRKRSIEK